MIWILNGIWNQEAQLFEIWTNGCHFFSNHLISGQKRLDFDGSGFQMVGTISIPKAKAPPFEIPPSKSPDFKCFWILNVQISDPCCSKYNTILRDHSFMTSREYPFPLSLTHNLNLLTLVSKLPTPLLSCVTSLLKVVIKSYTTNRVVMRLVSGHLTWL